MEIKPARKPSIVRVIRHIPQGLSVEMDNGQQGIVRVREISWDEENVANWRTLYPIGWSGYAVPIPSQKGGAHEFSLRFAESDPWDTFSSQIEKGRIYEGIITSVVDYGAFVEISPGLTGLLHYSQFPAWCKKSPPDLFWPGDKIFVTVREANRDQRQIALGLPPLQSGDGQASSTAGFPMIVSDIDNDLEKLLEVNAPRKYVLVVEDEKPQSDATAGWLRKLHQRVDVVENAEDALNFLEKTEPDIALVDVGLPGMSGTDLAANILEQHPQVKVINVTDWARANEIMDTLDSLHARGAQMLLKPLLPEDLVPYLLQSQDLLSKRMNGNRTTGEKLTLSDVPKLDANRSIRILLERCRDHLKFEQIILFSFDPTHRQVTVVERAGDGLFNKSALPYLIYSPVRDVAEDREAVTVNEIGEREEKRFKYLSELCPSALSCIGVPVQTQSTSEYALFVLDKRPRQITNEQQLYVEGMALAIGAALEQNDLREKFITMQRTALIGHLTRAMMHEINNLVGPLLYEADTLKRSLSQYEKKRETSEFESIHKGIQKIQQDIRKVINTTRTFGRIVAKGKSEIIRVDEIIYETLGLLRDVSERLHVVIHFNAPDELIVGRSHAVILQQVFLNVVLNAIQQIASFRPEDGGWVKVKLEQTNAPQRGNICRILVEDNGPGIHSSLWEKIFEAGFTTRQDGSGIGLYISRNLMEDIDGRIQVIQSHILSGSTFLLEFPIHL